MNIDNKNQEPLGQGVPGFGQSVTQHLNHYISLADTKAAAVVAGNVGLFAFLVQSSLPKNDYTHCLRFLSVLALAASTSLCAVVLIPRRPSGRSGLIFWEDILTRETAANYWQAVSEVSLQTVEREFSTQNWYLSKVLQRKYLWMQLAIISFFIAVLLVGVAFLF